jgi:hypothetical protein
MLTVAIFIAVILGGIVVWIWMWDATISTPNPLDLEGPH